jgi:hypothetical protein
MKRFSLTVPDHQRIYLSKDEQDKQMKEAEEIATCDLRYIDLSSNEHIIFALDCIVDRQKRTVGVKLTEAGYSFGTKPTKAGKTVRGWSKEANQKAYK